LKGYELVINSLILWCWADEVLKNYWMCNPVVTNLNYIFSILTTTVGVGEEAQQTQAAAGPIIL